MPLKKVCLFVCCILLMGHCAFAEAIVFDRILAVVNEDIVTQSEFGKFTTLAYLGSNQKPGSREAELKLLEQLVEKKLLEQEAKRLNISVKNDEVDQALQEVIARNNTTFNTLKEQLEKTGISIDDYRHALRAELLASEVIGREVQSKISISEADMEKYYLENIKPKERAGARSHIQQILLVVPKELTDAQAAAVKTKADALRAQIDEGADFGKLAFEHSQGPAAKQGGDLGYFNKGELLPEIEQAAFTIPSGSVSPVIRTAVGFHIIKVIDRNEEDEERTWKDHRREIKVALFNRAFEKLYTQWYTELRQKAYIKINY